MIKIISMILASIIVGAIILALLVGCVIIMINNPAVTIAIIILFIMYGIGFAILSIFW